jgi:hypothetical protein
MRRVATVVAMAFAAAASAVMLQPLPVAAECPYLPAWPPITTAVGTARVIVVGEVVSDFDQADLHLPPDQGARDYALRVTEVLRGDATVGDLLDVQYLLPNWPQTQVAGITGTLASCSYLHTTPGEVIAIAFDALQPGGRMKDGDQTWIQPPTRYNAMGVIRTSEPFDPDMSPWHDRERVTLRHLRGLVSLPMTDTVQPAHDSSGRTPFILVAGFAAGLLALRRFRERRVA